VVAEQKIKKHKMNIKFIKISISEEIIAECQEKKHGIFIKDPALIMSLNEGKLILGTWLPYTTIQKGFFLPEKAYLFCADVEPDMLNYYNKWRTKPFETDQTNDT
jgi:hypothetical protein